MARTNQDFSMYTGESKIINVTVFLNGSTADITGSTIEWVLEQRKSNIKISKSTGNGIEITDGANGRFRIIVNAGDSVNLSTGTYRHEAKMEDTSGNVSQLFVGTATVFESAITID